MKKTFAAIAALLLLVAMGCRKDELPANLPEDESTAETVSHEMIELGRQMEDPYSVGNMTKALESVYPTKSERTDLRATDQYVRFLPRDWKEYETLEKAGFDLMDHPLDYQIVKDGDYYHDPSIPEDEMTWQYAVVPSGTAFPKGIRCEILDECYIPDSETTKADGIDWEAVEREAFRLTGNEDMLEVETRSKVKPSGRITIIDEDNADGKPFGVAGVKVVCNSFVKFSSCYTDRDGYYQIRKGYRSRVRYRLMFKNKKGFAIGFNKIIVPASTSALGRGPNSGIDITVTSGSNRKLWCRCIVNNAGYDYYTRCGAEDLDIDTPPGSLRFWLFQSLKGGCTPMMRQGTIIESDLVREYLGKYGKYAGLAKILLPDVMLGMKGRESYSDIYGAACHAFAHGSHFDKVGKEYWNSYMVYLLRSLVNGIGDGYGSGTEENASYCEVAEMWAFFMQNLLWQDRYGGTYPSEGQDLWFHPEILSYIHDHGVSVSQIYASLDGEVTSRDEFQMALEEMCPSKSDMIQMAFAKY